MLFSFFCFFMGPCFFCLFFLIVFGFRFFGCFWFSRSLEWTGLVLGYELILDEWAEAALAYELILDEWAGCVLVGELISHELIFVWKTRKTYTKIQLEQKKEGEKRKTLGATRCCRCWHAPAAAGTGTCSLVWTASRAKGKYEGITIQNNVNAGALTQVDSTVLFS